MRLSWSQLLTRITCEMMNVWCQMLLRMGIISWAVPEKECTPQPGQGCREARQTSESLLDPRTQHGLCTRRYALE